MDLGYINRLVIASIWAVFLLRYSLADEELEAVKNWMPKPYQDRKIMQLVEQQLMKLFGFKRKVDPRKTLHIPDHMWDMYRKWNGEIHDDTDKLTNIVRIIHHDGELCFTIFTFCHQILAVICVFYERFPYPRDWELRLYLFCT